MRLDLENRKPQPNLNTCKYCESVIFRRKIRDRKNITGNTQISKTELEKLFPLDISK